MAKRRVDDRASLPTTRYSFLTEQRPTTVLAISNPEILFGIAIELQREETYVVLTTHYDEADEKADDLYCGMHEEVIAQGISIECKTQICPKKLIPGKEMMTDRKS